jgi:hypothetical protein
MPCKLLILHLHAIVFSLLCAEAKKNAFPESPNLPAKEDKHLFANLLVGDDRDTCIEKLQEFGYLGYRELQSNLVKSPVRWGGHAYELTCKFDEEEGLELCLIQGEAGWQDFFYEDIVRRQWESLRSRVSKIYGLPKESSAFPEYHEVPLNDSGGVITDRWETPGRSILLSLQAYTQQDCCTRQVLDFSCCILLIQPK